jgi:hypothetical protein
MKGLALSSFRHFTLLTQLRHRPFKIVAVQLIFAEQLGCVFLRRSELIYIKDADRPVLNRKRTRPLH